MPAGAPVMRQSADQLSERATTNGAVAPKIFTWYRAGEISWNDIAGAARELGRFAAVGAMRVLKYVSETPSALSEIARVAEPGAPVVFDAANGRSLARFGYVGSPMGFVTPTSIRRLAAGQGLTVDAVHDGPRLPHAVLARAASPLASQFTDAVERTLACMLGPGRGARSLIVEARRAG